MEIKPNMLVLVVGQRDFLKKETWGLVVAECGPDSWHIRIPAIEIHKGALQDFLIAKTDEFWPVIETDGTMTDPEKAVKHNISKVMATLFKLLLTPSEPKPAFADIDVGTLVIVLKENGDEEDYWGLIKRIMPDSKLMVIVDGRWLVSRIKPRTALVSPKRIIPVIATDGKINSPRKAFFKNLPEIAMKAVIGIHKLMEKQART